MQAGIWCDIIIQLLDLNLVLKNKYDFYHRLSMILEQKYPDTDKSITRGKKKKIW